MRIVIIAVTALALGGCSSIGNLFGGKSSSVTDALSSMKSSSSNSSSTRSSAALRGAGGSGSATTTSATTTQRDATSLQQYRVRPNTLYSTK